MLVPAASLLLTEIVPDGNSSELCIPNFAILKLAAVARQPKPYFTLLLKFIEEESVI